MSRFFDQYPEFYKSPVSAHPNRLHERYRAIIGANRDRFPGARVLDVGAHDGRWGFAALQAGAEHVTMIEPRPAAVAMLRERFAFYGVDPARYDVVQKDVSECLAWIAEQAFDVVLMLGFLYHTGDHLRLMEAIGRCRARTVIVDTEVTADEHPVIRYRNELDANARCAYVAGQSVITGTPSLAMVRMLLEENGFVPSDYSWHTSGCGWAALPDYQYGKRVTVAGYR